MLETCQKLAFTHPVVVLLKSGLKNNWMKILDRVNRPLEQKNKELVATGKSQLQLKHIISVSVISKN